MTTQEQVDRWGHTLQQAIVPFDNMHAMATMNGDRFTDLPNADDRAKLVELCVRPVIEEWETTPIPPGTVLRARIEPVAIKARALAAETKPTRAVKPVRTFIGEAKKARDLLATGGHDAETADEVVDEIIIELKVLVLAARLGHHGIKRLIEDRWGSRFDAANAGRPDPDAPLYIDVLTTATSTTSSQTTLTFPHLLAAAHPGVGTIAEMMTELTGETRTPIQARFAGLWVVAFYTEWELNYRPRLAKIHGCTDREVRSKLMQDLNFMRNDYAHNRGIAGSRQKRCKRLKWFTPGDRMQPLQADYAQLLREFEDERPVFTTAPAPTKTSTVELKGHAPQDLVDRFTAVAKAQGLGNDEALQAALLAWSDAND